MTRRCPTCGGTFVRHEQTICSSCAKKRTLAKHSKSALARTAQPKEEVSLPPAPWDEEKETRR